MATVLTVIGEETIVAVRDNGCVLRRDPRRTK